MSTEEILPYRPNKDRVRSVATTIKHRDAKYHVVVGYDDKLDPRVVRIFPSFKFGTDMSVICQIFSNYITVKLQVYKNYKTALRRLVKEEPLYYDGTPYTIVSVIAKMLLKDPHL
tara:strand:- start:327 stop:671 length:345 start_codon:yes stop_codon:yes gene_type:complete